jgi:hypothetical protein
MVRARPKANRYIPAESYPSSQSAFSQMEPEPPEHILILAKDSILPRAHSY